MKCGLFEEVKICIRRVHVGALTNIFIKYTLYTKVVNISYNRNGLDWGGGGGGDGSWGTKLRVSV